MSFMVIRFKERNLQRRIWNCVKIAKIEIWQISVFKGVNVFQNTPFKDRRILRWKKKVSKVEWLFLFKIKQEMCVPTSNWWNQCTQNCSWVNFLLPFLVFGVSYLVSLWYMKLLSAISHQQFSPINLNNNPAVLVSTSIFQPKSINFCFALVRGQ